MLRRQPRQALTIRHQKNIGAVQRVPCRFRSCLAGFTHIWMPQNHECADRTHYSDSPTHPQNHEYAGRVHYFGEYCDSPAPPQNQPNMWRTLGVFDSGVVRGFRVNAPCLRICDSMDTKSQPNPQGNWEICTVLSGHRQCFFGVSS